MGHVSVGLIKIALRRVLIIRRKWWPDLRSPALVVTWVRYFINNSKPVEAVRMEKNDEECIFVNQKSSVTFRIPEFRPAIL